MPWKKYDIDKQIQITQMFSLFEEHLNRGYDFPGETHDFWECVYISNGEACASADGRVYNLSSGEIIFHKPLEFHKLSVDSEDGADIFIFTFTAEGNLMSFFENKVFRLLPEQNDIIFDMLKYIRKSHEDTQIIPDPREFRYIRKFSENPIYAQTVVVYIYLLLLSLADKGNTAKISSHPDAKTFRRAISFMNEQVYSQISTVDIAQHCNVSLATLKRIFDKYAGISIHQYFLKLKMKKAAELLQASISVSDTAIRLGFSSQAYFSKAFKRETGINPSEIKM